MKKCLFILTMFFFIGNSYAQEDGIDQEVIPEESQIKLDVKSLSVGLHAGSLSYIGDIEGNGSGSYFGFGNWSYGVSLEKKLGTNYGILVNGLFGKVTKSEMYANSYVNFSSQISHVDINFMLDFDNGKSIFSTFVSVGLGFMVFNPKGDLSSGGVEYNYWSDGTFRDLPQGSPGADTNAVVISRDYDYETELEGRERSYATTALTVPIWAGFKFKLSRQVDLKVAMAYVHTFTDNLDNVSNGGNDKLFYTSFGVNYNFVGKDRSDKYRTIDFGSFFSADSDNDGVNDKTDMCQETPEGVKVNAEGCPLDGDKDGVPDYLDKEPNTPANTTVDRHGVTWTDEKIEEQENEKEEVEIERKKFNSSSGDNPN